MDKNKKRYLFRLIVPAFPSFNVFSGIASKTTALGPISVATNANKLPNWDVEVIDENNYQLGPQDKNQLPDHREIQKDRPADVVGFYGSLTCTIPRLFALAKQYKAMGVTTLAGGKHIEALPKEALTSDVDTVVFGEGEDTIIDLLTAWAENKPQQNILGIGFMQDGQLKKTEPRPLLTDFDRLPLPDFGLLRYAKKISLYPVNRSRGCNMHCEFCAVKDQARCSSAERLLAQITKQVETREAKYFFIVDDHFSESVDGAIKFCHLVKDYQSRIKKRLSFSVQIRLNDAKNEELLRAMKEAGVKNVFIGYESPIDEELIAMKKGYLSKDMVAWTKKFHQYGFFIHGMFIFGYPRHDLSKPALPLVEKVKRFKQFINRAKIDTIQILQTIPIPGTELRDRLIKQGRVFPKSIVGWEYYDGQFPVFFPDDQISPEEMQQAVKKIMTAFYHFNHFWKVGLRIVMFPLAMFPFFTLKSIKANYKNWYYYWWNDVKRYGGYVLMHRWLKMFSKDNFLDKLEQARQQVKTIKPGPLTKE